MIELLIIKLNFTKGNFTLESVHEFFTVNRTLILFIYGLVFFTMGLVIFLQSRRNSRLRLARDLRWLAAFGVLHGIHEWGDIFVPIQAGYLSESYIQLLWTFQIIILALSFVCLFIFGAVTIEVHTRWLLMLNLLLSLIWLSYFIYTLFSTPHFAEAYQLSNTMARYLICFPGSLLAAYGLHYQVKTSVQPLKIKHIEHTFQLAVWALFTYAIFGGLLVHSSVFFPGNLFNRELIENNIGIPIEVFRSLIGLVLAVTIIRALEIFEIELDQFIETMEVERIQAAERERIGQEIHDGAIQGVYSASLILESLDALQQQDTEVGRRIEQAKNVLNAVNMDLRSYMVSLRAESPSDPLISCLQNLIQSSRFQGLLDIDLEYDFEPALKPLQVHHVMAIVQESLSNTLRHARARKVKISIKQIPNSICLCVEDDGRGFISQTDKMSYGIRSMRDRARLLGGKLDIESLPGKGTKVIFILTEEKTGWIH